MKFQLSDILDIIIILDLAFFIKKLMYWKEIGGVEKLFVFFGRLIIFKIVFKVRDSV